MSAPILNADPPSCCVPAELQSMSLVLGMVFVGFGLCIGSFAVAGFLNAP